MAPYGQQRALSIKQRLCHMSRPGYELLRSPPPNTQCPSHQHAPICAHRELCLAFPVRQVPVLSQGLGGAEAQSSAHGWEKGSGIGVCSAGPYRS